MNASPHVSRAIEVPAHYSTFVQQMMLQAIWLVNAHAENLAGPIAPGEVQSHIHGSAEWSATETGFRVLQTFVVSMIKDDQPKMRLEVVFGMDYASSLPMSDELFQPLNLSTFALVLWPYLREFVATILSRMNWSGYVLPILTVPRTLPVPPQSPSTTSAEGSVRRRRPRATKPKGNERPS